MKKFKSRIVYAIVLFLLVFISLIVHYFFKQNDPVESQINDWSKSMYIFNQNLTLDQNDPLTIEYIQKHHLYPPSHDNYQLINQKSNPSWMMSLKNAINIIFNGKRNGVFVEARACDGELISNTLEYEMKYNWTGILIEPNPMLKQTLIDKHRKAWFADVCLSTIPFPQKVRIIDANKTSVEWYKSCYGVMDPKSDSRIHDHPNSNKFNFLNKMSKCFPIFSILSAVGFFDIDFFSLDVDGLELKILETIPFEKINIKVFAVKFNHIPEGKHALKTFMISKGYYIPKINSSSIDLLFIKIGYSVGNIN